MSLVIRGAGSQIAVALQTQVPGEEVITVPRDTDLPLDADRYLICQGLLRPRRRVDQSVEEIDESLCVNLWFITDQCERIFAANNKARVCIIGSESGFAGSYDDVYAAAKRELHRYVQTKRLFSPGQQLACIAPGIIEDCGMTLRRADRQNLLERRSRHPKQRFLTAAEVARWVYFVLYVDTGFMTNQIIRLNGGEHLVRDAA